MGGRKSKFLKTLISYPYVELSDKNNLFITALVLAGNTELK